LSLTTIHSLAQPRHCMYLPVVSKYASHFKHTPSMQLLPRDRLAFFALSSPFADGTLIWILPPSAISYLHKSRNVWVRQVPAPFRTQLDAAHLWRPCRHCWSCLNETRPGE
jgi:hypothetical protein